MIIRLALILVLPLLMGYKFRVIEFQHLKFPRGAAPDPRPLSVWPMYQKKIRMWYEIEGKMIYDHQSNLDPYGFRITPSAYDPSKKWHLILAGCSYTYGMGVEDEQSFPYILATQLKDYSVHNFSVNGGSSADILYLWRYFFWRDLITQPQGLFIFTFMPDHLERLAGSWRFIHRVFPNDAIFEQEGNRVEYRGVWSESWKWKWMHFLKETKLDYLWLRGTWVFRDFELKDSERLYVSSLLDLKKEYLNEFPNGRFILTKFPFDEFGLNQESVERFKTLATQAGIEMWDFPYEKGSILNEGRLEQDDHPNAEAQRDFALRLKQKIQDINSSN